MTLELRPLNSQEVDVNSIEYGLDILLSHLNSSSPHLGKQKQTGFPWRIMTWLTEHRSDLPTQMQVSSREEALEVFKQSDLLDCRISLFPYPVPMVDDVNAQIPNAFLIDLDRKDFETDEELEQCLHQTLQNCYNKLKGLEPLVIWSGRGYHIPIFLDANIVLENVDIFNRFTEPSRKFIHYAEMLLTGGGSDKVHIKTVTFNNCLIRVPNSYNSKCCRIDDSGEIIPTPQSRVRIEQLGNNTTYRPNIRYLLEGFWEYLIQERNNEILERLHKEQRRLRFEISHPYDVSPKNKQKKWPRQNFYWVERLLQKPLHDWRWYSVTYIFAPYFINVKHLSDTETSDKLLAWLSKSAALQRLKFNAKLLVKSEIKSLRKLQQKGKFPIPSLRKLKVENPELYELLKRGIIN